MYCHLLLSFISDELPQTAKTVTVYICFHIFISIACIFNIYI